MTKQNGPTKERELILDILLEILEYGGYSHVVLKKALDKHQYLEKQNRAFITRVAEGTLEYLLTIDAVIDQCSKTKVKKMKPVIRTILRMSVYQILKMDRIPDSAVCDEAVKLAVKRKFHGLKGFVNGVLRTISREKETFVFTDWSRKYSMPDWIIELWKQQYPAETVEHMLQAFLEERPTSVRCNLDRASMEEILHSLEQDHVTVQKNPLADHALLLSGYDYLDAVAAFRNGWITVQDVSSSFVGEAADPKPGDVVLDVCGAPGGKSLHIADKLAGTGQVVVRDLTENKILLVEDN
ncbi:MAG: transcription antitermination factor NusB, partial [Clostridium sp.]